MLETPPRQPHALLNEAAADEARRLLEACCGCERWVRGMLELRPFASSAALYDAGDRLSRGLDGDDVREAFAHHPPIGAPAEELAGQAARSEQAGALAADEATREQLRQGNAAYRARFGFVFLVCATGKSAGEMLGLLRGRLGNDAATELGVAAAELAKITRLRLEKLAR